MSHRAGMVSVALLVFAVLGMLLMFDRAAANPPANQAFQDTWSRTDLPVADGQVNRTWMWGPDANTGPLTEPYDEAVGGEREVQYFDKSRMEINDPGGDPDSIWFVTNGLLAMELITGEMQFGDQNFVQYQPAEVQIAGDPHPDSPTYAQLEPLLHDPATPEGQTLMMRLNPDGSISQDSTLLEHGVTAAHFEELRGHTVASPFWQFMHEEGPVHDGVGTSNEPLFINPFYATGLPVTEAYWVNVPVAGEFVDVLAQCFERRCLTYAPDNDPGWQVEAGNIGQHYYDWRQEQLASGPPDQTDDDPGSPSDPGSDDSGDLPEGMLGAEVDVYEPIVLTDETVVASPSTEALVTWVADDFSQVHFEGTSPELEHLAPGNVLVLEDSPAIPHPMIVVINHIDRQGSITIMETEPGWLSDVIYEGGFTVSASVPSSSIDPESIQVLDPERVEYLDEPTLAWGEEFEENFGDSVTLDGELSITGDLNLDYDIRKRSASFYHFEASVTTTEHARVELEVDGETREVIDREIFTYDLPSIFTSVGPLPLYISNEFSVVAGVDITTSGDVNAGFQYDGTHTYGIRYDRDDGWGSVRESSRQRQVIGPHVEDEAKVQGWITPAIESRLYGTAGTKFSLPIWTSLEVDSTLAWSIDAGMYADLALVAYFPALVDLNHNLARFTLWESQLAAGDLSDLYDEIPCSMIDQIPEAECEALLALYDRKSGDDWTNNSGWGQSTTPCDWYGVGCVAGSGTNSNVQSLQLNGNGLSGNRLAGLGLENLTRLTHLDLSNNPGMSGPISSDLGQMPRLEYLDLSDTSLRGGVPGQLGNAGALREVRLSNSGLDGQISTGIAALSNLEVLELQDNELKGTIPAVLGGLSNLTVLKLQQNELQGEIPGELAYLHSLEELNLFRNELTGLLPREFGNFSSLRVLRVGANQLEGWVPSAIAGVGTLTYIDLHRNDFHGPLPDFRSLESLDTLHFRLTNICISDGQYRRWLETRVPDINGLDSAPYC